MRLTFEYTGRELASKRSMCGSYWHHHTTMLAMAYWLTGSVPYAEAAANQISSWRAANPFLSTAYTGPAGSSLV